MSRKLFKITAILLAFAMVTPSCKTLNGSLAKPTAEPPAIVEPQPGQEEPSTGQEASPTAVESQPDESAKPDDSTTPKTETDYPVPDGAQNVMNISGVTNFQVQMTLKEAMLYYKDALGKKGLTEDTTYTATTDTTFNMVFSGSADGKKVVVQGVDIGDNMVNISIRSEKL